MFHYHLKRLHLQQHIKIVVGTEVAVKAVEIIVVDVVVAGAQPVIKAYPSSPAASGVASFVDAT